MSSATRGNNTLGHVYSNIKHAYRAITLPHLGQSDHISLLLFPAYVPLSRSTEPNPPTLARRHFASAAVLLQAHCLGSFRPRKPGGIDTGCALLCWDCAVLSTSQLKNGFGLFLGRNPGCQRKSRCFWKTAAPPSGQMTSHCTALQGSY